MTQKSFGDAMTRPGAPRVGLTYTGNTVECSYNAVKFTALTMYIRLETHNKHPISILNFKPWGVYCEDLGETQLRYNGTALHYCSVFVNKPYLLVGQGIHVSNNLSSHFASLCWAVLECSLYHWHDESQWWSIDEVNEFRLQQWV